MNRRTFCFQSSHKLPDDRGTATAITIQDSATTPRRHCIRCSHWQPEQPGHEADPVDLWPHRCISWQLRLAAADSHSGCGRPSYPPSHTLPGQPWSQQHLPVLLPHNCHDTGGSCMLLRSHAPCEHTLCRGGVLPVPTFWFLVRSATRSRSRVGCADCHGCAAVDQWLGCHDHSWDRPGEGC